MRVTHISLHICTTPLRRWKRSEVGLLRPSATYVSPEVFCSFDQMRGSSNWWQLTRPVSRLLSVTRGDLSDTRPRGRLSPITGHTNSDAVMDTNDAHFALISGNFDKASTLSKRFFNPWQHLVELAALEGLARIYLALGRLAECDHALNGSSQFDETVFSYLHSSWGRNITCEATDSSCGVERGCGDRSGGTGRVREGK